MNLNDLKRKHNAMLIEGQAAYAKVTELYEAVRALQKQIEAIEGDDYDPIPVIFGSGFYIHEDGETIEVPNAPLTGAARAED
jgi:hypothetical protein